MSVHEFPNASSYPTRSLVKFNSQSSRNLTPLIPSFGLVILISRHQHIDATNSSFRISHTNIPVVDNLTPLISFQNLSNKILLINRINTIKFLSWNLVYFISQSLNESTPLISIISEISQLRFLIIIS
jgi:hypothetical protein